MQAMEKINAVTVKKRLPIGGIVLKNVFGVNIVATGDMTENPAPCRIHGEAQETA
jgi:CxxC motif-containing protein